MKVLDWDYKDGEVPKNLFSKLTNTELEKCYRSRIRILAKREYYYEPYNDMIRVKKICLMRLLIDFSKSRG